MILDVDTPSPHADDVNEDYLDEVVDDTLDADDTTDSSAATCLPEPFIDGEFVS